MVWRGIWESVAGDHELAGRLSRALRDSLPGRHRGAGPELIDAMLASHRQRWSDVIAVAAPIAWTLETGYCAVDVCVGPYSIQWLTAIAYERLADLDSLAVRDSAASMYERLLVPTGRGAIGDLSFSGFTEPFARLRLVHLYATMPRHLPDAERHWAALTAMMTRPDPEMRDRLDQARIALDAARLRSR